MIAIWGPCAFRIILSTVNAASNNATAEVTHPICKSPGLPLSGTPGTHKDAVRNRENDGINHEPKFAWIARAGKNYR
jgi:hypothetical protein